MTYNGYEILTCAEYNANQMRKYDQAWKDYDPTKGGQPQIAFYFFYKRGERRIEGYVAVSIEGRVHQWGRTVLGLKRKINKFNKEY